MGFRGVATSVSKNPVRGQLPILTSTRQQYSSLLYLSPVQVSSDFGGRTEKLWSNHTRRFRNLVRKRDRKFLPPRVTAHTGHGTQHDELPKPSEDFFGKVLKILQNANTLLPYVAAGSPLLALSYPPSFSWFTNRFYAPALGFLMFAVGINLKYSDFIHALKRPSVLGIGYVGQYIVKPLLGVFFMRIAVSWMHLPQAIGSGIVLMSCVSGAQLSNYATFLVDPSMAPLSIVMTALSTATAVFMTPMLTLLLLGTSLPVDVQGMMLNIIQIVMLPITAGLFLNKFASPVTRIIRPCMPLLSILVTGCCMGSPLALNVGKIRSPFGLTILLLLLGFHSAAFVIGYKIASMSFSKESDIKGLQKTISFETGMQSSLLGLALANRFFPDPLVGLPSAISTALMSLMGFTLVVYWNRQKGNNATES